MTGRNWGKTNAGAAALCAALCVALCAAAIALSACHKDSGTAPAVAPAIPKMPVMQRRGPSVAEQTAGMVEAAVQGKSQAPVQLKFDLAQRPKVGQSLEISLALIPQVDASPATVQVSGGDDVTVAAGASTFDIATAEAGQVYRQSVNVTPTAEGVLLVAVSVSLKHDEITDVKAFSIPIIAEK